MSKASQRKATLFNQGKKEGEKWYLQNTKATPTEAQQYAKSLKLHPAVYAGFLEGYNSKNIPNYYLIKNHILKQRVENPMAINMNMYPEFAGKF